MSVADTNLFPDEAGFTSRPAWQVIEAARRRYLTGELTLPTTPTTRIFLRDGMVYFAERSSDGALPIRLMMEGRRRRGWLWTLCSAPSMR